MSPYCQSSDTNLTLYTLKRTISKCMTTWRVSQEIFFKNQPVSDRQEKKTNQHANNRLKNIYQTKTK